jgi:hypothetical protein
MSLRALEHRGRELRMKDPSVQEVAEDAIVRRKLSVVYVVGKPLQLLDMSAGLNSVEIAIYA